MTLVPRGEEGPRGRYGSAGASRALWLAGLSALVRRGWRVVLGRFGGLDRGEEPVEHRPPAPKQGDLVGHRVAGRVRAIAEAVTLRPALDLAQLGRPGGQERAAQGPQLVVRPDLDLDPQGALGLGRPRLRVSQRRRPAQG